MTTVERWTRTSWLALWLLVSGLAPCIAHAETMTGHWSKVHEGDTPASIVAAARAGKLHAFDPSRKTAFPRNSDIWIVLQPVGTTHHKERMLTMPTPVFGQVTLYDEHGPVSSTSMDDFTSAVHGFGRITLFLPFDRADTAPIVLRYHPWTALGSPLNFRLQDIDSYSHQDMHWMAMTSACFGVMLTMMILALCFAGMLRDQAFFWFAAFIGSYALVQSLQTGFAFHPMDMHIFAGKNFTWAIFFTGIMLSCAQQFMRHFCNLTEQAPNLYRLMLWLNLATLLVLLFVCIDYPPLRDAAQVALTPLLALWMTGMLIVAVISMWRGSRMARYFIASWGPLLVLTTMKNLQSSVAWLGDLTWLLDACLLAATFGSVVLSLGLADRTRTASRDRDRARMLADRDALTGLLNRRAWGEAAARRLADASGPRQVLFFLDLDCFKTLNDCHGHAAGDTALTAVARILRNNLSPEDIVGRYGGEEFIVLTHCISRSHATDTANNLCRCVETLGIPVDTHGKLLTVSIGATAQRNGDRLTSMIRRADLAMYAAKSNGRNRMAWECTDRRDPASPMRDTEGMKADAAAMDAGVEENLQRSSL